MKHTRTHARTHAPSVPQPQRERLFALPDGADAVKVVPVAERKSALAKAMEDASSVKLADLTKVPISEEEIRRTRKAP